MSLVIQKRGGVGRYDGRRAERDLKGNCRCLMEALPGHLHRLTEKNTENMLGDAPSRPGFKPSTSQIGAQSVTAAPTCLMQKYHPAFGRGEEK
jgi:hypothetical protein